MRIENRLTLRQLKAHAGRSAITTFGIIISVAMITAVLVAATSFFDFFGATEILTEGDIVAVIYDGTDEIADQLRADERIDTVGIVPATDLCFDLGEKYNERQRVGSIFLADAAGLEQYVTTPYEGTLPSQPDEIAVEASFIEKNELTWKIGDQVNIPTGKRLLDYQGELVNLYGSPYTKGERFQEESDGSYTITAVLNNNYPTYRYYSILKCTDAKTAAAGAQISFQLKQLDHNSRKVISDIMDKLGLEYGQYRLANELLESKYAIGNESTIAAFLPAIIILLIIIIIASITLIYNAFAISLGEKIRYLGMLASVGATRKQKRASVYFEGFVLGCIGIPLGLILGIAGMSVTLHIVEDSVISAGMIKGLSSDVLQLKTVVPIPCIVLIILFSILTIYISALIPARKASNISIIDALRQREEIKVKARKLKAPGLIRRIFGYEGELAYKNQKRNGRKGMVITASIVVSVVLFLTVNYICNMLVKSTNEEAKLPYQLSLVCSISDKETVFDMLDGTAGVDNYYLLETDDDEDSIHIGIETRFHEETKESLFDVLPDLELDYYGLVDHMEDAQQMKTVVFVLRIFIYGFVCLITLITLANIINSVSTGVMMRKKEFAMLQSVGMTPKGFRRMISLECLLYGMKATLIGIPLSLLLSYWMNRRIANGVYAFEVDITVYVLTILAVFAVVGITMFYSVHSIRNERIVETLKQEIDG